MRFWGGGEGGFWFTCLSMFLELGGGRLVDFIKSTGMFFLRMEGFESIVRWVLYNEALSLR